MKRISFALLLIFFTACAQFERHSQSGYSQKLANDPGMTSAKAVQQMEFSVDARRERELYSHALPWFESEDEKLEFLSLKGFNAKREWLNERNFFKRNSDLGIQEQEAVTQQDIYLGMTQEYVMKSWGEPEAIDVSGNPNFKNERWKYTRSIASESGFQTQRRFVYFEGGRVVGWEQR